MRLGLFGLLAVMCLPWGCSDRAVVFGDSASGGGADDSATDADGDDTDESSESGAGELPDPGDCDPPPLPAGPDCELPNEVITLATFESGVYPLAVDDTDVFVATNAPDVTVYRIDKCGGAAIPIAPAGGNPAHMAVDDDGVYWSNYTQSGAIKRVGKDGSGPSTLAEYDSPLEVIVDDGWVYWAYDSIMRVPTTGGPVEQVADPGPGVIGLVANGNYLYFTTSLVDAQVGRVPKRGGPIETLVTDVQPGHMLVDCDHIYWTDEFGQLIRSTRQGTDLEIVSPAAYRLAQDQTHVYMSTGDGTVWRMSKEHGTLVTVAIVDTHTFIVGVDETHVYWSDAETGTVRMAPKNG